MTTKSPRIVWVADPVEPPPGVSARKVTGWTRYDLHRPRKAKKARKR